ncbi:MAG: site-2 protease family protein [Acidobacteriota bacterium]|nr:site-2 protease family protein [Acidobacteriota bacterium]
MDENAQPATLPPASPAEAPAPPDWVHNCPECSHWLPEGTLQCPDCKAIVYTAYLNGLGNRALIEEQQEHWQPARDLWQHMLRWLPPGTQPAAAVQARIDAIDARFQAEHDQKERWKKRLGPLAPVALFLIKAKTWIFALFKFKFLLSFFAFFGLYWALFGWQFGLGFTVLILLHELGHYVAVRRRGLKADLPIFLPGLGAYVRWYHLGVPLQDLAAIALAGPIAGFGSALACLGIAVAAHSRLFAALAYSGAWLNLINLVPVLGLDGAQATLALNRVQRGLILILAGTAFYLLHETAFLFIALGMAWRLIRSQDAPEQPSTRTMTIFLALLLTLGGLVWFAGNVGQLNR